MFGEQKDDDELTPSKKALNSFSLQVGLSIFGSALLGLLLDPADVLLAVLRVGNVWVGLSRALLVWIAHQILDSQQDLRNC